jgi:hypothetical protein
MRKMMIFLQCNTDSSLVLILSSRFEVEVDAVRVDLTLR